MNDDDHNVDKKRRKFLLRATTALSVVGAAMAAVPFVSSLMPTAKAKAKGGPVRVKIGQMKPGDQLTVVWRGRPVWIVRRTEAELKALPSLDSRLRDPHSTVPQQPIYAKNVFRSRKPEFLVLVGVCTHLGCTPTYRPVPKSIDPAWPGGFFCSCHGSKFDLSGRVYKGVPAPINMEVPPYVYLSEEEILIGVSKKPEAVA